ncbi:hypothetical protein AQUCO_06000055v1 [Aquilegia coerulea]|uniref:Uncharacterized protein n=1 Tax=Aquilegia coerulea TaxID=218851 RepID=A0A2G5CDQ9_AQUCA|nr:hypothetical protein AQUCO_06000055v1 [Aquilegia coerulea]
MIGGRNCPLVFFISSPLEFSIESLKSHTQGVFIYYIIRLVFHNGRSYVQLAWLMHAFQANRIIHQEN